MSEYNSVLLQAEDGIRVAQGSRGLGDVYKRQAPRCRVMGAAKRSERLQREARVEGLDAGLEAIEVVVEPTPFEALGLLRRS